MATALAQLSRYEEAIVEFRIATELAPRFVHAYNNLGVTYVQLGQYEEALTAYQQTIVLDSTFVDAYTNLAWLYTEHGSDLDRALQLAEKAVLISPTVVSYETLAIVRNARGDYIKADEAMAQAIQFDQGNTNLKKQWEQIKKLRGS